MKTSGLENLTILLVEDNTFMLDLLDRVLRHLGFERIHKAHNGEEAIRFLRQVRRRPDVAGTAGVDLVISDLLMTPINGLLLLQWVRTSKDSPNRFMPFVMLSGAADEEYVEASRHLGVGEFLAKPFSINSVLEHLRELIERPRPFILTKDYFGPDRRRQALPPPIEVGERRDPNRPVKTSFSSEKINEPAKNADVWIFHLPNTLKDKLGRGSQAVFDLPLEMLERAEAELDRVALDFHDWARDYLNRLGRMLAEAEANADARRRIYRDINGLAHELRGQGGLFGYPLMTTLALSLFEATEPGCPEDDDSVAIIRAHIDTMRIVVRDKVKGDGGEVGRLLLEALRDAIAKHSRNRAKPKKPAPPRRAR
ncbi:response regulator [Rhodospira trueperi]|uniref:Response regulator receiver domain-containing protein n=1 Tax=Rhodospira trueperi TaxID=69960 RepID=A0A1G7ABT1_9PROT|nr:response regulator [Rhodospira trueperi]SDE12272.1 Response regulator receiver domain-containing protein [Rhodospira trueperi]